MQSMLSLFAFFVLMITPAAAQDNAEQMINDYIEQAQDVAPPDINQIIPLIPETTSPTPPGGVPMVSPQAADGVMASPSVPVTVSAPPGSAGNLNATSAAPPIGPVPPALAAEAAAGVTPADLPQPVALTNEAAPAPPAEETLAAPAPPKAPEAADENLFFDAEAYVPSQMTKEGTGVKKVSPKTEPASRFVVVKKNYDPSSKEATMTSADRALKLGRYEAALELYDQAYAKNENDSNVLMGRALALQHLDRNTEAVMAYEEILNQNPDNVSANVNMLGLIGKQYPAVAMRRLVELQKAQPNNASVYAQLAVVQANVGQYKQALDSLGVAAGIEPTNASHVFNMGVIADRSGEHETAIKYYEQALELDAVYGGSRSVPRDAIFERLAQLR